MNGIGGQHIRGIARLVITNNGNVPLKGKAPVVLSLVNSTGGSVGSPVASIRRNLSISAGRSVTLVIPIRALPAVPAAGYWLLASVTDPFDSAVNTSVAQSHDPIAVAAPVIALSAAFPRVTAATENGGAVITITNSGNVDDVSKFKAVVGLATDAAGQDIVGSGAGIILVRPIRVRAGKSARLSVSGWKSLAATLPAGSYYLTLTLTDASGNSAFAVSGTAVGD
jgi:hypothetical protein